MSLNWARRRVLRAKRRKACLSWEAARPGARRGVGTKLRPCPSAMTCRVVRGTGERFATGKWRAARFIVFTDKGLRKSISTHKGCASVEAYGNSW